MENLEEYQIKALMELLAGMYPGNVIVRQISSDRLYTQSDYYGESRYHVVTRNFDGDIVLDQIEAEAKYQQRVTLETAEIQPLLHQLLTWFLERVPSPTEEKPENALLDEPLGDLDDHPF